MSTNRLEAFSDGVMAVAITLLVLNIAVPQPRPHGDLAHELGVQWPIYAAYATSFITIGIIWINHHAMISRLRQADHTILALNLVLLMTVALLPFATDLIAEYLKASQGQHLAAAIYSGAFLVMSIVFLALNRHIMFRKRHFLEFEMPDELRRRIIARGSFGLLPYAVATGLAAVSPYVTLVICAVVAVYYALPVAIGE
jgi:uncharacterized membrane protein